MLRPESLTSLAERYGLGETLTRNVLVVDDDPENLTVLRAFLEGDYAVHEASSGPEALGLLANATFDVIIADQRMPGMTGIDLLERVRIIAPDTAGILLTAYTDTPVLISAINRARVFRHLRKPWEPEELLAVVSQACDHVHQARLNVQLLELLARRSEELGTALDNLRTAQQQMLHLERLGTIGRLTAGITHDLRNTLAGLMLLESQLDARGTPPRLLEMFRIGVAAMQNFLVTLTTLHQYASGGRFAINVEPVAPEDIVRDSEIIMRMEAEFREVELRVQVHADMPRVMGDRPKLVQALVNLLRNALQASEHGRTIALSVRDEVDAGEVLFVVEDEGPGVSPEVASRLFEPFVSTKGQSGMGMGLYMARLVTELHKGSLRLAARPDGKRGARFELRLPAQSG